MQIRPFVSADLPAYHACVDAVAREGRWLARDRAFPIADSARWAERLLAAGMPFYVADDGTAAEPRIVGWIDIAPGEDFYASVGTLGMGLLPAHRGRGLGRRLLETALARAWAAGLSRVELQVYAGNRAACRLYQAAGFTVEGVKRRAALLPTGPEDIVIMGLLAEDP